MGYGCEMIQLPRKFLLSEFLPGLPDAGEAASVNAIDLADERVRLALEHPEDYIILEDEWAPFRKGRVHCDDAVWEVTARVLIDRWISVPLEYQDVARICGRLVLSGALGVTKRSSTDSGGQTTTSISFPDRVETVSRY